jgi:hypothetical protein
MNCNAKINSPVNADRLDFAGFFAGTVGRCAD